MSVRERADKDLIDRFLEGDEQAFNLLVRKHSDFVYNVSRKIAGNHEDAIEISQRVFIKVYEKIASFKGKSAFRTWIYRVTSNEALNFLRSKRIKGWLSFSDSPEEAEENTHDPLDSMIENEKQEKLMEAVKRLPERQRCVFMLRMTEGLSYDEISAILNTSVGSLKASFFHAVKKVTGALEKVYGK